MQCIYSHYFFSFLVFHATYSRAASAAAAIAKIPYAICSASNSMMLSVGVHMITDAAITTIAMIVAVMIAFFIFFTFPFLVLLVYHPLPDNQADRG